MANKPSVGKVPVVKVGLVDKVPVVELEVDDLLLVPDEHGDFPNPPVQVLAVRRTKQFVYVKSSGGLFKIPATSAVPIITAVAVMEVNVVGNATVH